MEPQLTNSQIPELPQIQTLRYENIFKVYKKTKDGKDFYFYNINNKIILPTNVDEVYLQTLELDRTLPWTILSYNIYGTIYLWYILYILNKSNNNKPDFHARAGSTIAYIKPEFISSVVKSINEQ
jgi:hypothetical protein